MKGVLCGGTKGMTDGVCVGVPVFNMKVASDMDVHWSESQWTRREGPCRNRGFFHGRIILNEEHS